MTDERPEPGQSVHAEGSGDAQMPVLGTGVQHNTFHGRRMNPDIVLVVADDQKRTDIEVGRTAVFSLEVTNHGNRTRRLKLRSVGVPAAACVITPAALEIRPNELRLVKVAVQARPSVPEAGEREVSIEAADTDEIGGAGGRWASNRKRLRVVARPNVTLRVIRPPVRDGESATYRTSVSVTNTGNTRLAGTVQAPSTLWIMTNTKVNPGRRFVDSSLVRLPGEFELGPGTSAEIPVSVEFPDAPTSDQRWDLLLRVNAEGSGVEDRLCSVPLVQAGREAEAVPEPDPPVTPPARDGWTGRRVSVPLLWLVAAAAGAVGLIVFAAYAGAVARPTAAAPAVVESPAGPSAPADSGATADTVIGVPDGPGPSLSRPMPCDAGSWIAQIAALAPSATDRDVRSLVALESSREKYLNRFWRTDLPPLLYEFEVSGYTDSCPAIRRNTDPGTTFLWVGPYPSKEAAARVCRELEKPTQWDCRARKVA